MKTMQQWLDEYGESHQNATNKTIHWVCVPVIFFTVIAFIWTIPQPEFMQQIAYFNWGTLCIALAVLFYARISIIMAFGMLLYSLLMVFFIQSWLQLDLAPLWLLALVLFVVAWIGQFVGHYYEGKKPSFFKDIQFLMIGPAWVMAFVFRKIGVKF